MTLNIILNGKKEVIDSNETLLNLIKKLNLKSQNIAIEVNEEIIPRSEYPNFVIEDKSRIEIISFVGGG